MSKPRAKVAKTCDVCGVEFAGDRLAKRCSAECSGSFKKEADRKRMAANPEKAEEHHKKYREANRENINERNRKYLSINRDKVNELKRERYAANRCRRSSETAE